MEGELDWLTYALILSMPVFILIFVAIVEIIDRKRRKK